MNGCLLLVCCLGGAGAAAAGERLRVGDRERTYALTQQPAPRALVIVLHGGGGSAAQVRASFGMDEVARRENLSIAYPDGIRRHWNDGRGDFSVHGGETPPDDVAFLSELARRLARDSGNTPVFVAGVSNGGMMAYRLACDTDNLFAGFAAVIANLSAALAKTCAPKTPRPMLIMNGTTDPLTPYHGGSIVFFGQNRGDVISAPDTFERWLRWNGCTGQDQLAAIADRDRGDGSTVERIAAIGCAAGGATVLYRVVGGGHQVPRLASPKRPLLDRFLGATNRDIEAAEEIWGFFALQSPTGVAAGVPSGKR